VVFSHDSNLVASGSDDNTVRIWRVATGECEQVLEGHADWVNSVAFSHDSKLVASGSFDKTIRVWNMSTHVCEHVIHQRQITRQLYFEAGDDGLVTDAGVISIIEESILSANASILSIPPPDLDLSINGNVSWIAYCGKEFFWLPAECRHGTTAISEKSVVIGCQSGRVVILTFSSDELSRSVK
jgi:WD40 repeat protein